MNDQKVERDSIQEVEFLKIALKHEIKAVEIKWVEKRTYRLSSRNDYLLLKYFLEFKVKDLRRKTREDNIVAALNIEEKQILLEDEKKGKPKKNVEPFVFECGKSSKTSVVMPSHWGHLEQGLQKVGSDIKDQNSLIVQIEINGIEAWIKNDSDYQQVLDKMREQEEKNTDFIKELSDNGGRNTPSEYTHTKNNSQVMKQNQLLANFEFSDEENPVNESAVDFDQLMKKKKQKKKITVNEHSIVGTEHGDEPLWKKILCCW